MEDIFWSLDSNSHNCSEATQFCGFQTAEYFGMLYIHTPITVFGLITNILNLVMFTRGRQKLAQWGSLYVFLVSLAAVDLGVMMIAAPFGFFSCLPSMSGTRASAIYRIYLFTPIANFFATASVWITTTMTIERYLAIRTLTCRRQFTSSHARFAVASLLIASLVLNLPFYFVERVDGAGDAYRTDFGESDVFLPYTWVRATLAKFLPILLVFMANALLLAAIARSKLRRRRLVFPSATAQTTRQSQRAQRNRDLLDLKCVSMLAGMSVTLLLCHGLEPFVQPYFIENVAMKPCFVYTQTYRNVLMLVTVLETFSYASNFLFYFLCNTTLRKVFVDVFCSARKRP